MSLTTNSESILCRAAIDAPLTASDEIMFMPAGIHTITPSQGGKTVRVQVLVNRDSATALEAQRKAIFASTGKRPYFDFNHEDRAASFWPESFVWRDGAAPGVYAKGEWSKSGREGVEGKDWRQFSPVFYVDNVRANPAKIVCRDTAGPNMGGLVNDPAFHQISPFWAKAGANPATPTNQENQNTMTPEELASLQAKNKELEQEVAALKAKAAQDNTDATIAAELKAKEAELKAAHAEEKSAQLEAKNKELEALEAKRRDADAKAAVEEAVKRGAIAAKDEESKASWTKLIVNDPAGKCRICHRIRILEIGAGNRNARSKPPRKAGVRTPRRSFSRTPIC